MIFLSDTYPVTNEMVRWDARNRPLHCSNCLHAKVVIVEDELMTRCAQGKGSKKHIALEKLLRSYRPLAFRPAQECDVFVSMDDDGQAGV